MPGPKEIVIIAKEFGLNTVKKNIYLPGVKANEFTTKLAVQPKETFGIKQDQNRDRVLYTSSLGTPVFTNLEIQGGSYSQNGQTFEFPDLRFEAVLMTVSYPKNIVKTDIQGRNGTVKEYISDGDYRVNIKGVLVGDNGHWPQEQLRDLKKALSAPIPLKINSAFLQALDIDTVVIEGASFPQEEGKYSMQLFDISAISDTPVELLIKG